MNRKKLREIQSFLVAVRQQEGDMSVQRLNVLLEAALHGAIDQSALVRSAKLSRSATSKNIASWCSLTSTKTKGPGYLTSNLDPMNLKIRRIGITEAGKNALEDILRAAGLEQ